MNDNLDTLGGLVDGGLVTGTLDSNSKPGGINAAEVADAHHLCANCGQHLTGNFCANCGQQAHVHRSLAHVGEEFLHGITHFDGKAWQTLPMLAFQPGRLTREYIMGKRARYIAPVPLFLLVVFLMFFVFSFVHFAPNGATGRDGRLLTKAEAIAEIPKLDAQLADLDRQIAAAKASRSADLVALQSARAGVVAVRGQVKARAEGVVSGTTGIASAIQSELAASDFKVDLGSATLDEKVQEALRNPQLTLYKIQGKVYKFSFLLVPLSLPWLWLMFAFRRNVRMYDHAVFALYSISFMSLLFVIGSIGIVAGVTNGLFWSLLIWVAPLAHMYAQLKGAYALSKFGAAWRTVGLALASVISLAIYLSLMVIIGVFD